MEKVFAKYSEALLIFRKSVIWSRFPSQVSTSAMFFCLPELKGSSTVIHLAVMSNLKQATWEKLSFTGKSATDHTAVCDYQKTFTNKLNIAARSNNKVSQHI